MKACLILIVAIGVQNAFAQSTNPLTAGARLHYGIIKDSVTRAAVKMPEELSAKLRAVHADTITVLVL
jgi:hypothetical protein